MSFAQSELLRQWHSRRAYERTRGQLFCMLHWKALKSKDVRGKVAESGIKGCANDAEADCEAHEDQGEETSETGSQITDIGRITNLMS